MLLRYVQIVPHLIQQLITVVDVFPISVKEEHQKSGITLRLQVQARDLLLDRFSFSYGVQYNILRVLIPLWHVQRRSQRKLCALDEILQINMRVVTFYSAIRA